LARSRLVTFLGGAALALVVAWPLMVAAQGKSDNPRDSDVHTQHKHPAGDENLVGQIAELREQVARLETAISKLSSPAKRGAATSPVAGGAESPSADRTKAGGVAAKYSNCLDCHRTRPSGTLPASHFENAAADAEPASEAGSRSKPMAGMGGMKKMGMGMGMMGNKGMGSMKPAKSGMGGMGAGGGGKGMGGGGMDGMMGMMSNMMGKMKNEMGGMGENKKPMGGMAGKGSGGGSKPDAGMGGMGMEDDDMEMAGMGAGAAGGGAMAPANDDSMTQMMKMM
jgi:hypothetical protein